MAVTFSGKWATNPVTFGVNFEARNDKNRIICMVSTEALQDIQPANASDTAEEQFLANQLSLQSIAEDLINAGEDKDGVLQIHSRHVLA
ncbi:DUF1488 family protein [Stenotrophomonas sp. SrG]|uniref:DUF1488 family protein n=1 Tax=Stenotrophomonas sp. SrG TaxID=3414430 RepID=UPI003CECCCAC